MKVTQSMSKKRVIISLYEKDMKIALVEKGDLHIYLGLEDAKQLTDKLNKVVDNG